jgi:chemotaxis protein CheC
MEKTGMFSDEEKDFVTEMMNVGAGNASAALEQMLNRRIDLVLPAVHIMAPKEITTIIDRPYKLITCSKMGMVGDIRGSIFFVISNQDTETLIMLADQSAGLDAKTQENPLSVIAEISNILAGVYLTSIHDFCNLNIYHTVPVLAMDMLQAVLDESIASAAIDSEHFIIVKNIFIIHDKIKEKIEISLILMPSPLKSIGTLVMALKEAKIKYGMVKS